MQPAAPGVWVQAFETLGSGINFSSAMPGAYRRLAGIALFGNGAPTVGSMIVNGFPLLSTLFEKSPVRSSAVGTVTLCVPWGRNWRWNSSLQKKNSLFLVGSTFGMYAGPPIV